MKLNIFVGVCLSTLLLATTSASAGDAVETAKTGAFLAFDADQNGTATAKEIVDGLFSLFAAADNDDSGDVSLEEFKVISLGYASVAKANGKLDGYNAVRSTIFKRWDLNSDGKLNEPEIVGGGMLEILDSAKFGLTQDDFFNTKFIVEMTDSLK